MQLYGNVVCRASARSMSHRHSGRAGTWAGSACAGPCFVSSCFCSVSCFEWNDFESATYVGDLKCKFFHEETSDTLQDGVPSADAARRFASAFFVDILIRCRAGVAAYLPSLQAGEYNCSRCCWYGGCIRPFFTIPSSSTAFHNARDTTRVRLLFQSARSGSRMFGERAPRIPCGCLWRSGVFRSRVSH
jgi:hypothetical protein